MYPWILLRFELLIYLEIFFLPLETTATAAFFSIFYLDFDLDRLRLKQLQLLPLKLVLVLINIEESAYFDLFLPYNEDLLTIKQLMLLLFG